MKNKMKGALIYVVIFIVILGVVTFFSSRTENAKNYNLTQVLNLLEEGKIEKIKIEGNSIQGVTKDGSEFRTYVPGMVANHVGKLIYDRASIGKLEAPTPTNISTKSEPDILKKGTFASPATAFER